MAKVIEIYDSDEDHEQKDLGFDDGLTVTPQQNKSNSEVLTRMEAVDEGAAATATTFENEIPAVDSARKSTSPQETSQIQSATADQPMTRKQSRRKDTLQPICLSPDMEFETIALDEEDIVQSTETTAATVADGEVPRSKPKAKILSGKSPTTKEEMADNACTELMLSADTERIIREIAEERVRINYLLASYNMPEIQFSLYTEPSVLEFQLDERIRQRHMRNAEVRRRRNQGDAGTNDSNKNNK